MLTYCSKCEKNLSKNLIRITNIKIKGKSRCADCLANKSFFDKIKDKDELEIIVSQFLTFCVKCRKKTEN